ncbi:homoisocitrate dehydrogenase [Methanobacterium spitsbergense]|uniref:NAD-dependent isocitrate dehydrogenase n=1 Tax=Methanobacterium spitsbergense TaxID=2874285 RepID=A0A8T5UXW4_9EURY|nr:homoisocitrate dehydrogenase [Methanobacterium spitsbergense]MBZ2166020.1 NAD-dependent isocitrate dehydrogenase [Methanobacterium spitsbergense]
MYKITLIPGDGVGPEVIQALLYILEAVDLKLDYTMACAGNACFQDTGSTIPDETILKAKRSDATLFGAVTTVPGQKSAIITLRKELDLYANIRPVKSYLGTNCLYNDLDLVIVRENTEGLYSGIEEYTSDGATALRVITNDASEKICKFAFEYAEKNDRKKVTAIHKANVLKKTDGIFKDAFYRISNDFPKIHSEDKYVDAAAMFLITKPDNFDVIVTTNLFGDILSDEGAGLVGGLGMVPSANIGDNNALFEPVHGSAPDITGLRISNPSAMILSAVMMMDHLGETSEARKLENALLDVLNERKFLTPDLGGSSKTMEMAEEIRSKLI